ncbi:hypothetical protein [Desulfitobacterium hafniense]|uniref:hypothetical protein n=1 Tax=Desulfitobacterium hafniense TaxID=49338 RepID=UPI000373830E|nr:hypothetical protein [Desulfitobacterium hafniense]
MPEDFKIKENAMKILRVCYLAAVDSDTFEFYLDDEYLFSRVPSISSDNVKICFEYLYESKLLTRVRRDENGRLLKLTAKAVDTLED